MARGLSVRFAPRAPCLRAIPLAKASPCTRFGRAVIIGRSSGEGHLTRGPFASVSVADDTAVMAQSRALICTNNSSPIAGEGIQKDAAATAASGNNEPGPKAQA